MLFSVAELWAVEWLHEALDRYGEAQDGVRRKALEKAARAAAAVGEAFGSQRRQSLDEALEPLRRQLLSPLSGHTAAIRTVLTGDASKVIPYVLDRIYREHVCLTSTDAEDRIGTVLEVALEENLTRGVNRSKNVDAVRQRLKRLRVELASREKLGRQVACGRWDAFLFRELALPAPSKSLGDVFATGVRTTSA